MEILKNFINNDELANLISASEDKVVFTIAYAEISNKQFPTYEEIDDFIENLKKVTQEFIKFQIKIEADCSKSNTELFVSICKI